MGGKDTPAMMALQIDKIHAKDISTMIAGPRSTIHLNNVIKSTRTHTHAMNKTLKNSDSQSAEN